MKLKEYLESIGQSQIFFANKLGMSKQSICGYCNERINPSKFVKEKIEELTEGKVKKDEWKDIDHKTSSSSTTTSKSNPLRDV